MYILSHNYVLNHDKNTHNLYVKLYYYALSVNLSVVSKPQALNS